MLKKEETILKEILWGERPVHHLSFVKIKYSQTSEGHVIENPRHLNVVGGPKDIARGLLRYQKEPEKLRLWSLLVYKSPEIYSLDLGREGEYSVFEEALKAATEKKTIPEGTWSLAKNLIPSFPKKRFLGEPDSTSTQG